jgi:hypothetical protein
MLAQSEGVTSLAFGLEGQYLATASRDSLVRVWDKTDKQEVARMWHEGTVEAVAFSPDGVYLASAGLDGTVRLWEGARASWLRRLDEIEAAAEDLQPSRKDLLRKRRSLKRALASIEDVHGADHPSAARVLADLGIVARQLGRDEEARSYLERARAVRARRRPPHF